MKINGLFGGDNKPEVTAEVETKPEPVVTAKAKKVETCSKG